MYQKLIINFCKPWGRKEWQGDWSDKSSKWTEELKKMVGLESKDDGIFWINVNDFSKEFGQVRIFIKLEIDLLLQS